MLGNTEDISTLKSSLDKEERTTRNLTVCQRYECGINSCKAELHHAKDVGRFSFDTNTIWMLKDWS